jgi:hypothetical protein
MLKNKVSAQFESAATIQLARFGLFKLCCVCWEGFRWRRLIMLTDGARQPKKLKMETVLA